MDFPKSTDKYFHKNGRVTLMHSTHEHAQYVQSRLRPNDLKECEIHNVTPFVALHAPVMEKNGIALTALYDDEPVAMFGVVPFDEALGDLDMGTIWMLGTNRLNHLQKSFYKTTKQFVDWAVTKYDYVENVVPLDHKRTILWLHTLGFDIGQGTVTINGTECIRFVRCAPHVEVSFQ